MSCIVYASCIEPEGLLLEDEHATGECPECKSPGADVVRYWRAEGSLNRYERWCCGACGYSEDTGTP